jgi:hypothetical protein
MDNFSDIIKISNDLLIPANNLHTNNLQRRQLKEVITDIIKYISRELIEAHKDGRNDIITNIPIIYSITNMSNKDSQRFVWYNVIEELKSKGYRVWIFPSADKCQIKITWISPEDETDIKNQLNIIAKHSKQF